MSYHFYWLIFARFQAFAHRKLWKNTPISFYRGHCQSFLCEKMRLVWNYNSIYAFTGPFFKLYQQRIENFGFSLMYLSRNRTIHKNVSIMLLSHHLWTQMSLSCLKKTKIPSRNFRFKKQGYCLKPQSIFGATSCSSSLFNN